MNKCKCRNATYVRGPLGRPPCPSIGCISEASRIESSFGPVELDEQPNIHEEDGVLGTNLLLLCPHSDHAGSCSIYAGRP
jgi:hypothetical protein